MFPLEEKLEELKLLAKTVKGASFSIYPINSRGQDGWVVYFSQKRVKYKGTYLLSAVEQAIKYINDNKQQKTYESV